MGRGLAQSRHAPGDLRQWSPTLCDSPSRRRGAKPERAEALGVPRADERSGRPPAGGGTGPRCTAPSIPPHTPCAPGRGPTRPRLFLFALIHRSAWKSNSQKFAVASIPSGAAPSTRQRHGGTPQASKRGDLVLFVAPLCSKELRLVTVQLPEKSWLSERGSTGLWPSSWYSKNVVEDVGFMVNEAPPSTRGAAFLLRWSPSNTKGGLQIWPKER
jgi:hypothetical protein